MTIGSRIRRALRALASAEPVPEVLRTDPDPAIAGAHIVGTSGDQRYLDFEDLFYNADTVKHFQATYLPYLSQREVPEAAPHIDIGAGRGEFAEMARAAGLPVVAVEPNRVEAESLAERGFDAPSTDGLAYLAGLPAGSVGSLTCLEVIEHLTPAYFNQFIAECARCLADGGVAVFETVNNSCTAVHDSFYYDLTHVRPYPRRTVEFYLKSVGLLTTDVLYLGPVPPGYWIEGNPESRYVSYALVVRRGAQ